MSPARVSQLLTGSVQPGELFGFYVNCANYGSDSSLAYSNGGPSTFANSELSLTTYYGKGVPAFTGPTYTYRQWNGTVTYDFVPVELQSFSIE